MTISNMPDSGDVRVWEDVPDTVNERFNPMVELGVTGLKRVAGIVDEEFLPALRGRKAIAVFREMSLNDSIVGALLFAIDKLIREIKWEVTPADQTPDSKEAAEFVEQCMDDMSHSWDDFISEVLSCLVYGWSWHEICYKKRLGPWESDPKKKSKYTDGKIGWRKMPIRAQETWMRWVFDDSGDVKALVQMAPPTYQMTVIPIAKSILFRAKASKGNPEGISILRTAYRSWYFKKRLEEFEGIGIERDLAGMPVAKVPADYLEAQPGTKKAKVVDGFRKMVRGVRRDENEGLILPIQYDPDTKQPLFDFELMSSSGARQFDTNAIIQRYEQRILMSVLADFILVGHEQTGSYSLHTDKTGIFRAALNSIAGTIADTLNRHAVPKLFEVNGWKPDELPKITPNQVDPPDLTQLAQFITATAGAGMQWFPDPELEKFLRDIARLPELPDDVLELKQMQAHQQQALSLADNQMQILSMQHMAETTAQGYTPEQAQQLSAMPTPDMQEAALPPDSPADQAAHARSMEQMGAQDQMDQAKFDRQMQMMQAQQGAEDSRVGREKQMGDLKGRQDRDAMDREKKRLSMQASHEERLGRIKRFGEDKNVQRAAQLASIKDKGEAASHKRAIEQAKLKAQQQRQQAQKPAPTKKAAPKKPGEKK